MLKILIKKILDSKEGENNLKISHDDYGSLPNYNIQSQQYLPKSMNPNLTTNLTTIRANNRSNSEYDDLMSKINKNNAPPNSNLTNLTNLANDPNPINTFGQLNNFQQSPNPQSENVNNQRIEAMKQFAKERSKVNSEKPTIPESLKNPNHIPGSLVTTDVTNNNLIYKSNNKVDYRDYHMVNFKYF